jgi:two-component system response regulator WspF
MRISIAGSQWLADLQRFIGGLPEHQIGWLAYSGDEAIRQCGHNPPDLLLLELGIKDSDAAETTRRIMVSCPCPILLLANGVESNAARIFEALGQGALDVINVHAPQSHDGMRCCREALLKKFRTIERLRPTANLPRLPVIVRDPMPNLPPLIAIGSSTGGPKALAEVLHNLPAGLPAAVVIVQHVNEEFANGLAQWLGSQSPLPVGLAVAGSTLRGGRVYIAATNHHILLTPGLTFSYNTEPRETPYRPSVDVFFKSVARYWPKAGAAVILTGMGRDGAEGMAVLRRAGWHTIAQDQASSVVYGMPKAAKELDAAVEILPLTQIAPALVKLYAKS